MSTWAAPDLCSRDPNPFFLEGKGLQNTPPRMCWRVWSSGQLNNSRHVRRSLPCSPLPPPPPSHPTAPKAECKRPCGGRGDQTCHRSTDSLHTNTRHRPALCALSLPTRLPSWGLLPASRSFKPSPLSSSFSAMYPSLLRCCISLSSHHPLSYSPLSAGLRISDAHVNRLLFVFPG